MRTPRLLLWALLLSTLTFAEDPGLQRVKAEAQRLRTSTPVWPPNVWQHLEPYKQRTIALHEAIRDWVESRLPASRTELHTIPALGDSLIRQLPPRPQGDEDWLDRRPAIFSVTLTRSTDDADKVILKTSVSLPCIALDYVVIYDYGSGLRQRVLEDRPLPHRPERLVDVRISRHSGVPSAQGNQVLVILREGAQCGSSWNVLDFQVATLAPGATRAITVLSGQHETWFDGDLYKIRLEPDDLLLQMRASSMDVSLHNRAHVLHYHWTNGVFARVDPVALRPQDFVDEWLTRPWSEMASRTVDPITMGPWHQRITHLLEPTEISGHFYVVQPCPVSGLWQIGIVIKKKYIEIGTAWFLVQSRPGYHFLMKSVGLERQPGCPGEASPDFTPGPSLFPVGSRK